MASGNFLLIENCLKCERRETGVFCHLPDRALDNIRTTKEASIYPRGAFLCIEGQPAEGVFVLCTGHARVSTVSPAGDNVILKVAVPGEVLGASAVLANTRYQSTIEAMEPLQANFIPQDEFLQMLKDFPEAAANMVKQLAHDCSCAMEQVSSPGLPPSVQQKMAGLLLEWSTHPLYVLKKTRHEIPMRITAGREDIARFVGATRKEVDSTLKDFQKNKWLRIKGTTWSILNKPELEKLAAS